MTAKEFLEETSPALNYELCKQRLRSSVGSIMDDYALYVLEESQPKWIKINSNDDLPKEDGRYEVIFKNIHNEECNAIADFQLVSRHSFKNPQIDKRWFLSYSGSHELTGKVTHYKFITPQPPTE